VSGRLFSNLVARGLGLREMPRPALAPLFASGPSLPGAGDETVPLSLEYDEVESVSSPTPRLPRPAPAQEAAVPRASRSVEEIQENRDAVMDERAPRTGASRAVNPEPSAPIPVQPVATPFPVSPRDVAPAPRQPLERRVEVRQNDASPSRSFPTRAISPVVPASVAQAPLPIVAGTGQRRNQPEARPQEAPVVRVTIGRVDVRLVSDAPAGGSPKQARPSRAPALSLDEYLESRQGSQR
jgi:hypothetical protein